MELTWKDKISFYITELRQKLPLYEQPKKQLLVLGGSAGGILILVLIIVVISITNPIFISSSSRPLPKLNTTTPDVDTSPPGANDQNTLPQPNAQSGGTNNSATNTSTSQVKTGKSEVVLQSKPFTTPTGSSGTSGSNGGSNSSLSQGTNGNASSAPGSGGAVVGTDLSNLSLLLQSSTGTPTTPPPDILWQTYYNARENYSISYPTGWQATSTIYNNHEGVTLYPPPSIAQGGSEEIGFGISQFSYVMPDQTTGNSSAIADILVDGYPGKLYTQGSLQANTIAAVFKYGAFYFGLSGTTDNSDMIYVFSHMLTSLQFYGGSY